jgi:hypothetical protein
LTTIANTKKTQKSGDGEDNGDQPAVKSTETEASLKCLMEKRRAYLDRNK